MAKMAKWKSPKQLGITPKTYGALVRIMFELRDGTIKRQEFDMELFDKRFCDVATGDCGTAHCIGGWINAYTNDDGRSTATLAGSRRLGRLYYPPEDGGWKATRKVAAAAIEHLLETGQVPKEW